MNVTASMSLKMIPKDLGSQPVFLCIDDTMVPKSGKNFEDVSKLFDHAVRVSTSLPFFRPVSIEVIGIMVVCQHFRSQHRL